MTMKRLAPVVFVLLISLPLENGQGYEPDLLRGT